MNIFVLDEDMETCCEWHVDKHVVKMPTEYTQMLSGVVRESLNIEIGYKLAKAHYKHPCTLWAKQSLTNWRWLRILTLYLNEEWKYRYNHTKDHGAVVVAKSLPEPDIEDIGLTPFAQAMPYDVKDKDNAIQAYQNFYNLYKRHLFGWKNREVPQWIV